MSNDAQIALGAAQSAAASASAAATAAAYAADLIGGGGSSSLTVVSGGTIDLPNAEADGWLVGYKVTATTVIEGTSFPIGSYIFERDSSVYGGWTYRTLDAGDAVVPAPDTTAPTVGTLASSAITETTFTLTVTGAADETALAPAPYAFSTDNGATYSAYQSSAVYNVTGKTGSTAYQCKHRTKDAAGNVSTGTAITVTTTAADIAPGWTWADNFTASDGTAVIGRTLAKGSKTWSAPGGLAMGPSSADPTINGNAVLNNYMPSQQTQEAGFDAAVTNVEAAVDYDLSTGTAVTTDRRVSLYVAGVSTSDVLCIQLQANGTVLALKGGYATLTLTGVTTGHPTTGTLTVKLLGGVLTATTSAGTATATVTTGTGYTGTGTKTGFGVREDGTKIDNFKARAAS